MQKTLSEAQREKKNVVFSDNWKTNIIFFVCLFFLFADAFSMTCFYLLCIRGREFRSFSFISLFKMMRRKFAITNASQSLDEKQQLVKMPQVLRSMYGRTSLAVSLPTKGVWTCGSRPRLHHSVTQVQMYCQGKWLQKHTSAKC